MEREMAFFVFNQNNSGGVFDLDKERGITRFVVVEAKDAAAANRRAERDQGHAYAVISYPRRPVLDAGRAKLLPIN